MPEFPRANANPKKFFFVRMITRDISLEDCILDLIDNSVDGAWQIEGGQPISLGNVPDLSKYWIDIEITADQFRIVDNCGGITLDEAVKYAFTFGREKEEPQEKFSIGVYGIGMKRAIFKMGNTIGVRSTYRPSPKKMESFLVPIDVEKWLQDDTSAHWDFDMEGAENLAEPGVEIVIDELNESTSTSFANPAFVQNLRRMIARDYALHLHRGVTVRVNGDDIIGWQIEMRQSGSIAPMRIAYQDTVNGGDVTIEILAGMAAPPPESADPDDTGEGEQRSGWYVVCNGRIVIAADKSERTGWGTDDWPKWHPQYTGFLGLILFSSEDASLLPLTTTKRSVDGSSPVYRRALPKMREVSRQWTSYTNVRKQTLVEAKKLEAEAKPLPVYEIPIRESAQLPQLTPKPKVWMANIAYSMPREKVRDLARELGNINMTYRDVGISSFEYTYADYIGEE